MSKHTEHRPSPSRHAARRALRHALQETRPDLVMAAEGFRAENSEMDLLAVGPEGELISVRYAEAGEDARTLVQCLSDLNWLRLRAGDLRKLAPGLGLEPSAEPRGLLVSPEFEVDTQSAVGIFPSDTLELVRSQLRRNEGGLSMTLEPLSPLWSEPESERDPTRAAPDTPSPRSAAPAPAAPLRAEHNDLAGASSPGPAIEFTLRTGFRTGLSESDLRGPGPEAHREQDASASLSAAPLSAPPLSAAPFSGEPSAASSMTSDSGVSERTASRVAAASRVGVPARD